MAISKINNNLYFINSPQMDNNTFILIKDNKAIVIDPSFAGNEVNNFFKKHHKIQLIAVVLTHAHFDHTYTTSEILKQYDVPVYVHKLDEVTYKQYNYASLVNLPSPNFDKNIRFFSGKKLIIDNFDFEIYLTSGHTAGSISIRWDNNVFVGDTLFYNSYGRTDLGNSSMDDLVKSLKLLWSNLKDDDLVLCGHSKFGTFKQIKEANYQVDSLIKNY